MSSANADGDSASRTRSRLWVAAVLIVLPFLGLVALRAYDALSRYPQVTLREQRVAHGFAVIVAAQALTSALENAERDQRGFLLTGQHEYLARYSAAVLSVPALSRHLKLLSTTELQQRQVAGLDRQIGITLSILRQALAADRLGGLPAAQRILDSEAGLQAMRSTEATLDGVVSGQSRLLTGRLDRDALADRAMQRVSFVSTLLALALLVAGVLLAAVVFRNSRRLQREISRRALEVTSANRQLQERNVELARASQLEHEAREQALRAERTKARFLATASHDLRQPLQALSMLNGALRRQVSDPRIADALEQQELAIGAMSRLLNALLDISKLESGVIKPQISDFPVADLLETLGREFRGIAASKGLKLEIEPCAGYVRSDPGLVEQILRNLLSNAVKYTDAGQVRLRAFADSSSVHIEVIDSGVGIAADQLSAIGEEFYQIGVSSNTSREGYGLGLSIVKRLVRLLDLGFEIRSEPGRGSTFALRLPQGLEPGASAPPGEAQGAAAPDSAEGRHVLVVEDDAGVRAATSLLLRSEGYAVTAVGSLDEALAATRSGRGIDLLVTDYHLPAGSTGLDVIDCMRGLVREPLKAVLITGDTSAAVRALQCDPNLRIASKPVHAEELIALVRDLLAAAAEA